MTLEQALRRMGFSEEVGGGGVTLMSRHFPNGVHIWATPADGGGLPEEGDWLICAYPPGDMVDLPLMSVSSEDEEKDAAHGAHYAAAVFAFASSLDSTLEPFPRKPAPLPSTSSLAQEYGIWIEEQGLQPCCALDHLAGEEINRDQRSWLLDFSARWEASANAEDRGEQLP